MNAKNTILKLKEQNIFGRGGAEFPVWQKWQTVKNIQSDKKYIICNGSEGEPAVFKDGFILKNYLKEVVEGVKIALKTIDNSFAYIYLKKDYYRNFKFKLEKLIKKLPVTIFQKNGGYLAGEETVLMNIIEGKKKIRT